MSLSVREKLLHYSKWMVEHKDRIFYEEVRPFPLGAHLPQYNDCSATFTNLYYLAGAPDPNGFNFNGYGNTASLAMNGQRVERDIRIGDAVIYYEGGFSQWDSVHVAIVVNSENQSDPLTMSHGQSSEPSFVRVSEDGRPHRFFRYAVNER
jgi:hypothetical protein